MPARDDAAALDAAAQQIRGCLRTLARLEPPALVDPNDRMNGLGPLLGLEGSGSAAYYGVLGELLKNGWTFPGRVKRPPTDPVNALLSFGYTVLSNQVVSLVCAVGLDPAIGVLHQPGFGKPALALDLMEEFRPLVVDSVVITMINTGQVALGDFTDSLGAYRLKDEPRKQFLTKLEERLSTRVQHPVFGYQATYRRCIELQARLFAKYAQGELERYAPFTVRWRPLSVVRCPLSVEPEIRDWRLFLTLRFLVLVCSQFCNSQFSIYAQPIRRNHTLYHRLRHPRRQAAHEGTSRAVRLWRLDAILAVRMLAESSPDPGTARQS